MKSIKTIFSIVIPITIVIGINVALVLVNKGFDRYFETKFIEALSVSVAGLLTYISFIIAFAIEKRNTERNAKGFIEEEITRFQNQIDSAISYFRSSKKDKKAINVFCNSFSNYIYFIKKVKYDWKQEITDKMSLADEKVREIRQVLDYLFDLSSFNVEYFIKSLEDLKVLLNELRIAIINSNS